MPLMSILRTPQLVDALSERESEVFLLTITSSDRPWRATQSCACQLRVRNVGSETGKIAWYSESIRVLIDVRDREEVRERSHFKVNFPL